MSVHDLIRRRESFVGPLSPQELVARYQRLRAVCRQLNDAMMQRLTKDALQEGGRKLGLLRNDVLVFKNEHETAVLMDYCLYHVRWSGRNAVEAYWHDHPPAPGTDEWSCLRAMRSAIYSLFRVDAVEPGVGLAVTDLATDEEYLLIDIGLSESAKPGVLFFSRLLLFEDFVVTGGAAIPLVWLPQDEMASFSADWKKVSTSRDADYDPAPLIRELRQRQLTQQLRYRDTPSSPVRDPHVLETSRKKRAALLKSVKNAGPTRRCPCGNGKMFKNCCLKKRLPRDSPLADG